MERIETVNTYKIGNSICALGGIYDIFSSLLISFGKENIENSKENIFKIKEYSHFGIRNNVYTIDNQGRLLSTKCYNINNKDSVLINENMSLEDIAFLSNEIKSIFSKPEKIDKRLIANPFLQTLIRGNMKEVYSSHQKTKKGGFGFLKILDIDGEELSGPFSNCSMGSDSLVGEVPKALYNEFGIR